ncbi:hypothetical protein AMAG_20039 [Allomyces macrogynus ATCC 38327]|uniref:Uncharacterized protein n=1 Tax=Allomyces macrogynus (strain ATCC 38327) TaxID=578462 RepID=A0A0L0T5D2_ALLM3|nr:hypothetical protein AMAG_20039 [Allomyces macrogynus ATCC 38327]|eukprot:KNE69769.1 hypothetical protein AMAG_20039 [Allomyces macrogynus ATCC 38327]
MGVGKGKGKPRLPRTGSASSGNVFAVLDPDAQELVDKVEEDVKVRDEDEVPTRWDEDEDEDEDEEERSTDGVQVVTDEEDADRAAHPEGEECVATSAHAEDAVEVSKDGPRVDASAVADLADAMGSGTDDDE